jgi:hypothetical protein
MLNVTAIEELEGRTITKVSYGHPDKAGERRSHYGVITLETDKGPIVLSCSMLHSELSVWIDKKRGDK